MSSSPCETGPHVASVTKVHRLSADRLAEVVALLAEAGARARARGSIGWSAEELDRAAFRRSAARGELFGMIVGHRVVGCMLLQDEDRIHWPAGVTGEALYIHKLAVARGHAGAGLGERLIAFACGTASERGARCVRLDTTPGTPLQAYYARQGFVADPLGPAVFDSRWLVRMEKRLAEDPGAGGAPPGCGRGAGEAL